MSNKRGIFLFWPIVSMIAFFCTLWFGHYCGETSGIRKVTVPQLNIGYKISYIDFEKDYIVVESEKESKIFRVFNLFYTNDDIKKDVKVSMEKNGTPDGKGFYIIFYGNVRFFELISETYMESHSDSYEIY